MLPTHAVKLGLLGAAFLAASAGSPTSLRAGSQGANLLGYVVDSEASRPIEGVTVRLEGVGRASTTNALGFFTFIGVPPGVHYLSLEAMGYRGVRIQISIPGEESYETRIILGPAPIELEGLQVTVVPRKRFSDMVDLGIRIERGFGEFLLRKDMDARGGSLVNLLQGLPGVQITGGGGSVSGRAVILRRARHITSLGPGQHVAEECYPAVFVDGKRFSRRARFGDQPTDLTEFLAVDMEAVEVYSGASVPAEFGGGDAPCGAVIIWMRRGPARARGT